MSATDLRHIGFAVAVGENDNPAASVLAQDLIGTVGFGSMSATCRAGIQPTGRPISRSPSRSVVRK